MSLLTDRNVVQSTVQGSTCTVIAGPSNDDFDFDQNRLRFNHQSEFHPRSSNDFTVKVIHQGPGAEVQWAEGDTMGGTNWMAYVALTRKGFNFNWWATEPRKTVEGQDFEQDIPFWMEFNNGNVRIHSFEGEPALGDKYLVFDSDAIPVGEDPLPPYHKLLELVKAISLADENSLGPVVQIAKNMLA